MAEQITVKERFTKELVQTGIGIFNLIQTLLSRKVLLAVYFMVDKYWTLSTFTDISTNTLYTIAEKDLAILIVFGLISFEKIKIAYNKGV